MEKRRAHYDLRAIQAQMSTVAGLRMTVTARHDALRAGVTLQAAVSIIQTLAACRTIRAEAKIWMFENRF